MSEKTIMVSVEMVPERLIGTCAECGEPVVQPAQLAGGFGISVNAGTDKEPLHPRCWRRREEEFERRAREQEARDKRAWYTQDLQVEVDELRKRVEALEAIRKAIERQGEMLLEEVGK